MPPSTGVASGFITSAPVRVDHMMGNRPATTVDTVMILGRKRKSAPSITASRKKDDARVRHELPFYLPGRCTQKRSVGIQRAAADNRRLGAS